MTHYALNVSYIVQKQQFKKLIMTTSELKDMLIAGYENQIENYKELSEVNDSIIAKQKEYIAKLQDLLEQSKVLIQESLSLVKNKKIN